SSRSSGWRGRTAAPLRRSPADREGRGMHLERVGPYLWRIPRDASRGMRVPGLVVADERLIEATKSDASLAQLANGAPLPGIGKAAMAMPDIHQGYGLPVGGVVATDARSGVVSPGAIGFDINCGVRPPQDSARRRPHPARAGVVSPGAIGFDINCGVRLLKTALGVDDIAARLEPLVDALYQAIPTGVGSKGSLTLDRDALDGVLAGGARWAVEKGYGVREDLGRI